MFPLSLERSGRIHIYWRSFKYNHRRARHIPEQISVERKFAEEYVAIFPLRPPKERHKIFIVPQVIFANFYNISYNIGIDKRNAPIS